MLPFSFGFILGFTGISALITLPVQAFIVILCKLLFKIEYLNNNRVMTIMISSTILASLVYFIWPIYSLFIFYGSIFLCLEDKRFF